MVRGTSACDNGGGEDGLTSRQADILRTKSLFAVCGIFLAQDVKASHTRYLSRYHLLSSKQQSFKSALA